MKTRIVVFTALLTALAVTVKLLFDITIPVAGVQALRISFSGVFLRFASVVFGPAAGGTAAGLADVIKHFIKPEGAYLPPLTLTAVLNGVFVGFLWKKIKNADIGRYGAIYVIFFGLLGCWGLLNILVIKLTSGGFYLEFLRQIGSRNEFTNTTKIFISLGRIQITAGLMIISAAALATFFAFYFIKRKKNETPSDFLADYLKILFATGIPCLLYTTVNTEILRMYFLLPDKAFLLLWAPRFIEEAIMVLLNAYLLMILLKMYNKNIKKS